MRICTLFFLFLLLPRGANSATQEDCSKCPCISAPVEKKCARCCILNKATQALANFSHSAASLPQDALHAASCVLVFAPPASKLSSSKTLEGVLSCRPKSSRNSWSPPAIFSLETSHSEAQLQGSLVLFVMNPHSVEKILSAPVTLGKDVSFGLQQKFNPDSSKADILVYGGWNSTAAEDLLYRAVLHGDDLADEAIYGRPTTASKLVNGTSDFLGAQGTQAFPDILQRLSPGHS